MIIETLILITLLVIATLLLLLLLTLNDNHKTLDKHLVDIFDQLIDIEEK